MSVATRPAPRFPAAAHAALGVAIAALWSSDVAEPVALGMMALALVWAVARERRGLRPPRFIERLSGSASFLYLAFFLADILFLSRNLLHASMRLLAVLTVLRVLGARSDRDRLQLLLISFLTMVSATASTTQIGFALPLVVYCVAALWALRCRQADRAGGASRPRGAELAGLSASALALGLVIFFLIPHVGTGYFRSGTRLRQEVSGFSGRIELGSINRIKRNHEIVMRVQVTRSGRGDAPVRWRGRTFDSFDGRGWSRTDGGISRVSGLSGGATLKAAADLPELRYEVTLEPIDTPFLFAAADPLWLRSNHFRSLEREAGDGLRLDFLRQVRMRYEVLSELQGAQRSGGALIGLGRDYPPEIAQRYLQTPPLDPGIRSLAIELAAGAEDPYRVAEKIERDLAARYTYTLDVQDAGVPDPMARFLLRGAPGHCEYFATAMALLLRLQGIPSRVVTGFQQGTYSDLHRTYLVRQSDAHSWVEVYFPGPGWVEYDPTPPQPVEAQAGMLRGFRRAWERVEIAWDTWIVGLDLNDQASVLETVRDGLAGALARLGSATAALLRQLGSLRGLGTAAAALLLLAAAAVGIRRMGPFLAGRRWRRRGRAAAPHGAADRLGDLYARFLAILAGRGIRRDPHLTPLEFAHQAGRRTGRPAEVVELTELFCRARYGAESPPDELVRRAESLLDRLARSRLRHSVAGLRRTSRRTSRSRNP